MFTQHKYYFQLYKGVSHQSSLLMLILFQNVNFKNQKLKWKILENSEYTKFLLKILKQNSNLIKSLEDFCHPSNECWDPVQIMSVLTLDEV